MLKAENFCKINTDWNTKSIVIIKQVYHTSTTLSPISFLPFSSAQAQGETGKELFLFQRDF